MLDTYIYIVDDLLFLCMGFLLLYLFVLAIASHFKRTGYPKTKKQTRCAILVSEKSNLPELYKQEPYEFVICKDPVEGVNALDKEHYQLVVILSDSACALSPHFMENILNAYESGIQAIQLHTVINNRNGFRKRIAALSEEINNTLFRIGNTQLGFSSGLFGTNMAFDLEWMQKNLRTTKTNLERKLFRQNIYIEYLPDTMVYCESAPVYPYRKRIRKNISMLLPTLLEGNWNFLNRIVQLLIPSPLKLCTFTVIWTLLMTGYNWTSSLKWWVFLFALAIMYSLAIPDYLVKDKKHSIWRKKH